MTAKYHEGIYFISCPKGKEYYAWVSEERIIGGRRPSDVRPLFDNRITSAWARGETHVSDEWTVESLVLPKEFIR